MDDDSGKSRRGKGATAAARNAASPEDAFDIWLHRHLHRLYDGVVREPVPPELLRLIEADREKRQA